jgi:hypothetical protein
VASPGAIPPSDLISLPFSGHTAACRPAHAHLKEKVLYVMQVRLKSFPLRAFCVGVSVHAIAASTEPESIDFARCLWGTAHLDPMESE